MFEYQTCTRSQFSLEVLHHFTMQCTMNFTCEKINNIIIINKIGNSCEPEEVRWNGWNSHLIENSKEILHEAAKNYQGQEWR